MELSGNNYRRKALRILEWRNSRAERVVLNCSSEIFLIRAGYPDRTPTRKVLSGSLRSEDLLSGGTTVRRCAAFAHCCNQAVRTLYRWRTVCEETNAPTALALAIKPHLEEMIRLADAAQHEANRFLMNRARRAESGRARDTA